MGLANGQVGGFVFISGTSAWRSASRLTRFGLNSRSRRSITGCRSHRHACGGPDRYGIMAMPRSICDARTPRIRCSKVGLLFSARATFASDDALGTPLVVARRQCSRPHRWRMARQAYHRAAGGLTPGSRRLYHHPPYRSLSPSWLPRN